MTHAFPALRSSVLGRWKDPAQRCRGRCGPPVVRRARRGQAESRGRRSRDQERRRRRALPCRKQVAQGRVHHAVRPAVHGAAPGRRPAAEDRKSVVEGKSVTVRVELGGTRINKKKRKNTTQLLQQLPKK